jgi:ubiquitin fusion degradation protein 1
MFGGGPLIQDLLMRLGPPTRFERAYNCYSVAVSGRTGGNLEDGDKILLPPSALHELAQMNVDYPMLFELSNPRMGKRTHCGVMEFVAEEGRCYIPFWMMQNLVLQEGDVVNVLNVSLKKATFVKFRPLSVDFLDISNPRAVLEKTLRRYTCVTTGDQICIPYLDKKYYLEIREVQPDGAASIIETDCNVDFEEPLGYKEEKRAVPGPSSKAGGASPSAPPQFAVPVARPLQKARVDSAADEKRSSFTPFAGEACRVDGKKVSPPLGPQTTAAPATAGAKEAAGAQAAPVAAAAQPRASLIGDKYSKKKVAVSAFTGPAHTLRK